MLVWLYYYLPKRASSVYIYNINVNIGLVNEADVWILFSLFVRAEFWVFFILLFRNSSSEVAKWPKDLAQAFVEGDWFNKYITDWGKI